MPSTHQTNTRSDIPERPRIEAKHGENPAKYLCRSDLRLVDAMIRGIQTEERLDAWQDVAVDVLDGSNLKTVIGAINQRRNELREGEQCR